MRDPKTHAKVLALREEVVRKAVATAWQPGGSDRHDRLVDLHGWIDFIMWAREERTGWSYDGSGAYPCWHYVTSVPDNGAAEVCGAMARAKALAERKNSAARAFFYAHDEGDTERKKRCKALISRIWQAQNDLATSTGLRYYLIGPESSYWRHTETIIDTEEEA